ncbi:MAG: ATP-binding protein [Anaerolineales bacterium]
MKPARRQSPASETCSDPYAPMATPARRFQTVARFDELKSLRRLVRENAQALGFSERESFACELAADEAFANIIQHAYGGESDCPILVRFRRGADWLLISFVDLGPPWDPRPPAPPNWDSSPDQLAVGGLGRLIIERSMDRVAYRRRGARNHLMLCKRRSPAGADRS